MSIMELFHCILTALVYLNAHYLQIIKFFRWFQAFLQRVTYIVNCVAYHVVENLFCLKKTVSLISQI